MSAFMGMLLCHFHSSCERSVNNIIVDKKLQAKMWELILQGRCQLRADLLIPFGNPREGGRAGEKRLFTCNVTPAGALEHRNRATDIVFARVGNFLRTSFHGGERGQVSNMPLTLLQEPPPRPPSRETRPPLKSF